MQGKNVKEFNLLNEIPIDSKTTLDQLTARFQSVYNGLPELIKNSKDQYSRLKIDGKEDRQIIVISSTARRTLAVIDFAGAPVKNFVGWDRWSDPMAGQAHCAKDIEAGYGNGGKAFMVRGATSIAFLESCYKGRRTRRGFDNNEPENRYKPGFAIVEGKEINDVKETDPTNCLEEALNLVSMRIDLLPTAVQKAFTKQQAFTIAYLEQVGEWKGHRRSKLKSIAGTRLAECISSHGQTARTIETCQVWVIQDSRLVGSGPVAPAKIMPRAGFEEPREFEIPNTLPDPETGEEVRIFNQPRVNGYLRLNTSQKQLQMSPSTRERNIIRICNQRNDVATWIPQELYGLTSTRFIYGKLHCPSLTGDHLEGAGRQYLTDTPLVRALRKWTAEKIKLLADEIDSARAEETSPKDHKRTQDTLSNLRALMRRYLNQDAPGYVPKINPKPTVYGIDLHEIILEPDLRNVILITGTRIPLLHRCIERQENGATKPVRISGLVLKSEPEDMFTLDADNMLTAHQSGPGEIWLETSDGSLQSNRREFWAIEATGADLEIPVEPLLQMQQIKLNITFQTPDGPFDDALVDGEVLDPRFGAINRSGRLKVGQKEGNLEVRIRYGADARSYCDFSILVGAERVPLEVPPSDNGDIPEILLCGEPAPGMEERPSKQRTMPGGPEYPTTIEDKALFPGIVWINPTSKEAMRVRRSAGGSSGLGTVSTKTFMHFVALKCFDILKRLSVRQKIAGDMVTEIQYVELAVEAEIECADFIDAAWDMTDRLLGKDGDPNEK